MRAWVLVYLCSMGVVARSACSARSLLTLNLNLKAKSGKAQGFPLIDVTQGGLSVRKVDKTDGGDQTAELILDDHEPTAVGVWLPSDVSGKVEVRAPMPDGAAARNACRSREGPPGERFSVKR
jgi:hypothetical protein